MVRKYLELYIQFEVHRKFTMHIEVLKTPTICIGHEKNCMSQKKMHVLAVTPHARTLNSQVNSHEQCPYSYNEHNSTYVRTPHRQGSSRKAVTGRNVINKETI